MTTCFFKLGSPYKELPKLVPFILLHNFPSIVHRRFKSKYTKWKVLATLTDSALEFLEISPEFLTAIHTNESFISALFTLLNIGMLAITPERDQSDSLVLRISRTDTKYAVRCLSSSLSFLQRVLQKYLENEENGNSVSPLCKLFFDDKSDKSI